MPAVTAIAAASTARNRSGSADNSTAIPAKAHNQPSPARVASNIHHRTQRGARHLFTRRITS
ncbi:MAG: hypothetical protein QOJ99_4565 [Bryobacterales bacterium]|nr:hypothetical protein [Bryobacterales bacterium]